VALDLFSLLLTPKVTKVDEATKVKDENINNNIDIDSDSDDEGDVFIDIIEKLDNIREEARAIKVRRER